MIRKNCSTYCPPHCEFEPDYCPPIDCPDGIICTELIPSDAIIFEGTYLECFGITAGMNLTDVVLALAALVFPECNTTTTTSTTTTTTLCQRPTGLIQIILVASFDDGATIVEFTASFAEACAASNLINNNPTYFLNTYVGEVSSFATNVTVYDTGFSTDCSVVPDGWYIDAADYTQIINIVGGIIVSIAACDVTTTSTTTTSTTTTSTTTTTAYPGPSGIFRYENNTSGGLTELISLGSSSPGFPSGYAISSGVIPVVAGQSIIGTHQLINALSLFNIWTTEAGSLSIYHNNVLILCTNVSNNGGVTNNTLTCPEVIQQTDDLVIIYSNNVC